jgi:hypothetical protein
MDGSTVINNLGKIVDRFSAADRSSALANEVS